MTRTVAELKEQAAACTLKVRDSVTIADNDKAGIIVQDGGYGYFKIALDGTGQRVIRHFTELVKA